MILMVANHHHHGHLRRVRLRPLDLHRVAAHLDHFLDVHRLAVIAVVLVAVPVCVTWWGREAKAAQREANEKELLYRRAVDNADRLDTDAQWRHQRALERVVEKEERRAAKEQARRDGEHRRWWRWWVRREP
jgi:hypothetical protein